MEGAITENAGLCMVEVFTRGTKSWPPDRGGTYIIYRSAANQGQRGRRSSLQVNRISAN